MVRGGREVVLTEAEVKRSFQKLFQRGTEIRFQTCSKKRKPSWTSCVRRVPCDIVCRSRSRNFGKSTPQRRRSRRFQETNSRRKILRLSCGDGLLNQQAEPGSPLSIPDETEGEAAHHHIAIVIGDVGTAADAVEEAQELYSDVELNVPSDLIGRRRRGCPFRERSASHWRRQWLAFVEPGLPLHSGYCPSKRCTCDHRIHEDAGNSRRRNREDLTTDSSGSPACTSGSPTARQSCCCRTGSF